MPRPEADRWVCAGTRRVSIAEGASTSPTDGLVSVYRCPPPCNDGGGDNGRRSPTGRLSGGSASSAGSGCISDRDKLHVFISDGAQTFYECIARKDIRHMTNDEGKELEEVASILLRPDDEVYKVNYKRVEGQIIGGANDSKSTASVKMSIRKTCANSIVRPVWQGSVHNIRHAPYDDLPRFVRNALPEEMDRTESSSGLSLPVMLGDTIGKLHKEIDALRREIRQLEANTLRWKSTSEKLSGQWEDEKSELTERFLTLFNEHKARHVKTQRELEQLRGQRQRTEGTLGSRSSLGSGRKPREEFPDFEDEHDYAKWNAETVDRLAAGRDSSSGKRRADERRHGGGDERGAKRPNAASQDDGSSGFVNPHTGATELSDPKQLFSSDEDDDMNVAE